MFWNVLMVGIMVGAIYTLVTMGYSMVYGILRLMNFAHGDVYIFGTLLAWTLLSAHHVSPLFAVLGSVLAGGALAALVEFVAYRRLRAAQNRMISMITALGAAYIIQNLSELKWGNQVLPFPSLFPSHSFSILGLTISLTNLVTLGIAVAIIVFFNLFLKHHKMGKAILCASEDLTTASLMGIPINRTVSIVYFLGGVLGVIGGVLYSSSYNVISISMGFRGTIIAFTAAVIGGIGSFSGALIGGMILGISENFVGVYVSSMFRDPIIFLLLVVILLVKPTGILGQAEIKKV
ncbi:branched-chain amino acid ABC transporter permease [Desulfatirhabdium butyrativorans]|uniref:branched-chain amino acid ABC transporter permease n=1 Tax=Desulfatirhabdium butyrativorans TaxID=340467 RepID=UPI0004057875|nr:branched-chain amino acid ABC transporter permease [Desulfatirhabdium butyrativorans]